MLTGGEREKKKKKGKKESCPLVESRLVPRSSKHPCYILEGSVAGPLDLACLKSLPIDISVQTRCGVPLIPTILQRAGLL
jgi:hypothetical protein